MANAHTSKRALSLASISNLTNGINDIEAPKALDVQLRLPERGKFCFGGHFKRWQKEFSPVLSPYKLVKSTCQFCEVPKGFLACKVVSHH